MEFSCLAVRSCNISISALFGTSLDIFRGFVERILRYCPEFFWEDGAVVMVIEG